MNLVWFLRYLAIAFDCVAPVIEAVWICSDRLKYEFDLLLIPITYQLAEWEYPKLAEDPPLWGPNPRLGRSVSCVIDHEQSEVRLSAYSTWEFVVHVKSRRNTYRHYHPHDARVQFPNRNSFMEHFLYQFYETPLGPEKPADKIVSLPPWTRTETGVWLCSL